MINEFIFSKNIISISYIINIFNIKYYLLSNLDNNKKLYSTTLKSYTDKPYPNEFLKKYYFLQMKIRFPQKHYKHYKEIKTRDNERFIIFHVPNLEYIIDSGFFSKNKFINYYIQINLLENNIMFCVDDNYKI